MNSGSEANGLRARAVRCAKMEIGTRQFCCNECASTITSTTAAKNQGCAAENLHFVRQHLSLNEVQLCNATPPSTACKQEGT